MTARAFRFYDDRTAKCTHYVVTPDGKRRVRCERWSKFGMNKCSVHAGAQRPYTAQESAAVLAAFMGLFEWGMT